MPSSHRIYEIFEGLETVESVSLVLVGTGPAGDPASRRRLVHPDSASFPPLVYVSNPDRTTNLDNVVLPAPLVTAALTMTSTRVTRFERRLEDVLCTEVWTVDGGKASMTAQQFRALYELFLNPPALDPVDPVYVVWEPRDRSDRSYEVELVSLSVGGSDVVSPFDVRPVYASGGLYGGGDVAAPMDLDDTVRTGLLDREVRLVLRVVAEVV